MTYLHTEGFYISGSVGFSDDVGQVELDVVPALRWRREGGRED